MLIKSFNCTEKNPKTVIKQYITHSYNKAK